LVVKLSYSHGHLPNLPNLTNLTNLMGSKRWWDYTHLRTATLEVRTCVTTTLGIKRTANGNWSGQVGQVGRKWDKWLWL